MARTPTNKIDKKALTPAKFSGPKDARHHEKAGLYPNYQAWKTRAGHVFIMDDSKFGEHITLQHRSGSMLQMFPDGAVQFVAHNGRYQFTFGEDRILVTGAQDVVVQGAASLRVEKDYNMTVMGDINTTVDGNYNITAKNFHMDIGGNIDIVSKNMTVKTQGSMEYSAHQTATFSGDAGVAIASTDGSVGMVASEDIGVRAYGKLMLTADGNIEVKSDADLNLESESDTNIKSGSALKLKGGSKTSIKGSPVAIDGSAIYLNSGNSDDADGATIDEIVLTEPEDQNDDRDRNPEIDRVHVEEDNGEDDERLNTTFEEEDDLDSDKDPTDAEPGTIPIHGTKKTAIDPNNV